MDRLKAQQNALNIGARAREQSFDGPGDYNVKVYGPNGRQIASFFIANASNQTEAETLVKKQISFKLSHVA